MTHDLEALKGLIAAATPGPWTKGEGVNRAAIFERGVQVAFARANHDRISAVQSEANAALIAAARTALPELVERVETATATIEGLRGEVEALRDALTFILPMAKGYAAANRVGRNAEMIAEAETLLNPQEARNAE